MSRKEFAIRVVIVLALVLVPILVYRLFDVVLIGVGAILVATILRLGTEPLRRLNLPQPVALALSGFAILIILGGASYLFGTKMMVEMQDVLHRVASAQGSLMHALNASSFGKLVLSHVSRENVSLTSLIGNIFSLSSSFLEAVIVSVFTGVYLAAQPRLYRRGFCRLLPESWRDEAMETIDHLGHALRLWLLGQLIQMVIIGLLSTLAAFAIGLPSPLAIGLIAGVAEFIPYLGPIISAVPAVLVAATVNGSAIVWTIVAWLLIHQVEGELIAPIVQRSMVFMPPVVMLMSVATLTYLFGWMAIIFAAPITVIVCVSVIKLYVRDSLGNWMPLPGETGREGKQ
ncbi:MAG: AI-2E family transporter [Beijerinckiaceae bacterium]|nr:MAG: AI-2E family transporter [Beijerinckiaceae bacterium]